jgi:hypothetical protein
VLEKRELSPVRSELEFAQKLTEHIVYASQLARSLYVEGRNRERQVLQFVDEGFDGKVTEDGEAVHFKGSFSGGLH